MAENRNVLNIGKMVREKSDHRVSKEYVSELVDIVETIVLQSVQWSDNAADVTNNQTLLVSHVPYYLIDRKDAIDRAIQAHYDKIDQKEVRQRERESKKSSAKFREIIDKDDKLKEELAKDE